ncbi:MAG: hypothetical protein ACREBD_28755 [Blastocatellia bacterium]
MQLDFSDFAELRGEQEALAAFDLGFAILHELVHGVLGLRDAVGETKELGECDELINQMRRELNLPERQGYSARTQTVLSSPVGATSRAELVFARERAQSGRAGTEWFYLRWEAKRVASGAQSKTVATMRQDCGRQENVSVKQPRFLFRFFSLFRILTQNPVAKIDQEALDESA